MGEQLVIDPVAEATGAEFALDSSNGIDILDAQFPSPKLKQRWASSVDTEGSLPVGEAGYENREIPLRLRVTEPQVGAEVTNLVKNPRFANDSAGWTPSASTGLTDPINERAALPAAAGSGFGWRSSATNPDATARTLGVTHPANQTDTVEVVAGQTYTAIADVYVASLTGAVKARIDVFALDGSNVQVGAQTGSLFTLVPGWQRIHFAWTIPAGGVRLRLNPELRFGATGEQADAYFTNIMAVEGDVSADLPDYFDGDTGGCHWTGDPHASSSVRPASGGPLFVALLDDLAEKLGKIQREGGTLRRTVHGEARVYDLYPGELEIPNSNRFHHARRAEAAISFQARPFSRGAEVLLGETSATAPVITLVTDAPAGSVLALGRLEVEDDAGVDQGFVAYGLESRFYSAAATAGLFFEAEALTNLGGATDQARTGASGGNVAQQATLTQSWQAMASLQHPVNGYPTHVGDFNVWVRTYRPTSNKGEVSLALEWATGDLTRPTRNDVVTFAANEWEGQLVWVCLGQVHLPKVAKGLQQWDGRVIAKTTTVDPTQPSTGDDLELDAYWLQPVAEGAAEVSVIPAFETPTAFTARDEFEQAAGALTGKTAPVGGVYSGAGDADDFQVHANDYAYRDAVTDAADTGREVWLDVNMAATLFQVDLYTSHISSAVQLAAEVRRVDANNLLRVRWKPFTKTTLELLKRVSGTWTTIATWEPGAATLAGVAHPLRIVVTATGRVLVWFWQSGSEPGDPIVVAQDSDLATGGALASGDVGLYDENTAGGDPITRRYDNLFAAVPTTDAAIFANQSLEFRHDATERENPAGTLWTPLIPEGDHLLIPPAGREARDLRTTVLASRGPRIDSGIVADPGIDAKTIRLYATPRYL